ncbi:MAG: phosphatase PAP2 family protein [Bacteroidia bacterium]|nr:phosphatase PAP2 family protein [Bacteroidia bacterium]MDW8333082.1 phosphatase PAP2 family protein [Bacteroidia bacterium]
MIGYWATTATGMTALMLLTITYGYEQSFLMVNGTGFTLGDRIFPHLTHLGDGVILASLLTLILWRRHPEAAAAALTAIAVSALIVNVLKFWVFEEWRRPMGTFDPATVRMLGRAPEYYFSFPSGHSATAGAGFFFIAHVFPRYGMVWGTVAFLTAFSRIYVGSHFPADVSAGFLIGCACALAAEKLLAARFKQFFSRLDAPARLRWRAAVYLIGSFALAVGLSNRYFGGWVG